MARQKIKFERLGTPNFPQEIADGYAGLQWDRIWAEDVDNFEYERWPPVSGTGKGLVFGHAGGAPNISATVDFDLRSGWFAPAYAALPEYADGVVVTMRGYDDGALVAETSFAVPGAYEKHKFGRDFRSIDRVEFQVNIPDGRIGHLAMDDLVIVSPAAPEVL